MSQFVDLVRGHGSQAFMLRGCQRRGDVFEHRQMFIDIGLCVLHRDRPLLVHQYGCGITPRLTIPNQ